MIQRLDADGNRNVLRFLHEAGLIKGGQSSPGLLAGVDLRGAHLEGVDLGGTDLHEAYLSYANLSYANLSYANLSYANLSYANLRRAILRWAIGINVEQIERQAATLEGAIMPDSSKHP